MKGPYIPRLELFAENAQVIKKAFPWQNTQVNRLAALLYAVQNKPADASAIRAGHQLIKENTGLFSSFRGNSAISIATLLALTPKPELQLTETLTVYDLMKAAKFRASDYLVVAAYQIAAHTTSDQYDRVIERAKAFLSGMRAKHPFLTGQDDYIFAAMLGLSDIAVEHGVVRLEQLYLELKPEFFSGNSVQALTQVLLLGEEASGPASRVLSLREAFRARGIRLDKEYTLPSLGILSLLPYAPSELVDSVSETYEFLRTQKGFGGWSVNKQELLLLAAALVSYQYVEEARNGVITSMLSTSLTNIIIAQQTAIAVAAASSAAAASSSSD
ncbi:DUF4003 family protein [Paenibacillus sp. MMS20-IR301]|uniref:DUF4003 family protein n=1 Tax=Paenibacillus sp. MMS20-IR301 TaxID=2895946 RepID=UPI0028F050B8|nr:DUF4003 family protein [Paenibacillus sp. MMS20-IR301]WNS47004.1 DUF4003 family protein [Paenibacillus sp. MMS20-IR301]